MQDFIKKKNTDHLIVQKVKPSKSLSFLATKGTSWTGSRTRSKNPQIDSKGISTLRKFFLLISVVIGLAIGGYVLFLLTLPNFFALQGDENIVFISKQKDPSKGKTIFAHFLKDDKQIVIKTLEEDNFQNINFNFEENTKQTNIKALLSFRIGHLVDEILFLPESIEIDNLGDLQSQLLTKIVNNFKEKKSFKNLLTLYFFSKNPSVNFVVTKTDFSNFSKSKEIRNCTIAVVNTTKMNGLANKVGNIYENSGFQVVRITSSQTEDEKSKILFNSPSIGCQELIQRAAVIFPDGVKVENDKTWPERFRAEIVVFLGKDLTDVVHHPL